MKVEIKIDKMRKSFVLILTATLIALFPFMGFMIASTQGVHASDDLYDDLEQLEKELADIKKQKLDIDSKLQSEQSLQDSLASQIYSLSNSISQLELNIKEKEIDIEKKETEIKILEEEITNTRLQITGIENNVQELEATANDIVKTIYIESKTNSIIDILLASEESQSFVSNIQYHTALGSRDKNTLEQLQSDKILLEEERQKMEDDKIEIEKLAEQIIEQKEDLEKDREQMKNQVAQKNQLLQNSKIAAQYYGSQYQNLSDEEMKKEAELNYILQQIIHSATKPKGYVVKGQVIAREGNNGCSTGAHTHFGMAVNNVWVNPCNYLPYKQFWYGTCSGNSNVRYPYSGDFYSSRGYTVDFHEALDLVAGSNKYVYAAHDGYFFEETPGCSNTWCSVGCKGPINPCVKVCEKVNCTGGKITIYCHVNFL